MIENDDQLGATLEELGRSYLELAAAERYRNHLPHDSAAQSLLRQISKMRADLNAYLGLSQAGRPDESLPFVIENDEQLRSTHRALGHLYRALAALRKDLSPTSRNYALYAQGNLDEIFKLQAKIDAYLGLGHVAPGTLTLRESPPDTGPGKFS